MSGKIEFKNCDGDVVNAITRLSSEKIYKTSECVISYFHKHNFVSKDAFMSICKEFIPDVFFVFDDKVQKMNHNVILDMLNQIYVSRIGSTSFLTFKKKELNDGLR